MIGLDTGALSSGSIKEEETIRSRRFRHKTVLKESRPLPIDLISANRRFGRIPVDAGGMDQCPRNGFWW